MSRPSSRTRRLTEKAMTQFEERLTHLSHKIAQKWEAVDNLINTEDLQTFSLSNLSDLELCFNSSVNDYEKEVTILFNYLSGIKTEESQREFKSLEILQERHMEQVTLFRDKITRLKHKLSDSLPLGASAQSTRSVSDDTLLIAQKYAEAESAQAKLQFVEKEAELQRKKAELKEREINIKAETERKMTEIEASLSILSCKKEAEAARVEAEALDRLSQTGSVTNIKVSKSENISTGAGLKENVNYNQQTSANVVVDEINKYLLRKELLLTRLIQFDDTPETYMSWKSSFRQVCQELNISASEEIDLMIKWLGKESRKHALSLKNVYRNNPAIGLESLWTRLDERYGSSGLVYKSIMNKLEKFPKLTYSETSKWYELLDTLSEIQALKTDPEYSSALAYFDSSVGTSPILMKLPPAIQEKWAFRVNNYKMNNKVTFPPFIELISFIREQASVRNDPTLMVNNNLWKHTSQRTGTTTKKVSVNKSDVSDDVNSTSNSTTEKWCPYHRKKHSLNECRAFRLKSHQERKQFLKSNNICFKCCESNAHRARGCQKIVKCEICGYTNHPTAMHITRSSSNSTSNSNGGETNLLQNNNTQSTDDFVNNRCLQICGQKQARGKSCAKIFLVKIYSTLNPKKIVKCYVIVDEQSNRSLVKPKLFSLLQIDSQEHMYTLSSCLGVQTVSGRRANNCILESLDGSVRYQLPSLIECNSIPDNRDEICTPQDALCHAHLSHLSSVIPNIESDAEILMILGRDVVEAHHIRDQIVGPPGGPFAQKLDLGWTIIGEVCLGKLHVKEKVNVNKIYVSSTGRPSLFEQCGSRFFVKDLAYDPIFVQDPNDDKPGLSIEDRVFLSQMDISFEKAPSGRWTAPLPFKPDRQRLPNNRSEALRRAANSLIKNLKRNPSKKAHMVEFMHKIFERGNAEVAPELPVGHNDECWYLPIFGVYNPKKPGQIRGVFDSSAVFEGVSLNSVLLSGPDLTNSLLGVLLRFRKESVAIAADIEQMFYSFEVNETHRNFLRFFWYKDNDPDEPLIEYRMCRHVFGNSSSPAIATYGLRKSVENSDDDVKSFVNKDFYVDDGLTSLSCFSEAVSLLKRTQLALKCHSLRLHKIASNNVEVLRNFPVDDLAKDVKNYSFGDDLPIQRSLGLEWDLNSDVFVFNVDPSHRPLSRRNILSVINSIFDPLGFLAPFLIVGKLILRDIVREGNNWDEPVSPHLAQKWLTWQQSLLKISDLQIPRCYFHRFSSKRVNKELHVFCDASEKAISAVAYLVGYQDPDSPHDISFVLGKCKVAPSKGHTIPRLELCSAVLAVEVAKIICDNADMNFTCVKFYTDSKIVLGYINNQSRRFYTYVSNRVQKIRQFSTPNQWNYIFTESNPADFGIRGVSSSDLVGSDWINGPKFLRNKVISTPEFFPLLEPGNDKEIRPNISVLKTTTSDSLGSSRFKRFSSWRRLVSAIFVLKRIAQLKSKSCAGNEACCNQSIKLRQAVKNLILSEVQLETFGTEIRCLQNGLCIPKDSTILTLDPFLDANGILRVGGRLGRILLPFDEKHPIIVSGKHHVASLLVSHYHEQVRHQGRHLTEGTIRMAGFWITGCKRLITSMIYHCVICRKLRGKFCSQKMSNLPVDRVTQMQPFSYVGVDVFGPWTIISRRTRGGCASAKRWSVMFTCLAIRAVHIEVIEDMSSSCFINALRRFIAIRGKVKQFRSDRGTNFVGAVDILPSIHAINVEDEKLDSFLKNQDAVWVFNPPHSSHMGGSWERMIGTTRRIFEALLDVRGLTHEVLITLMAEASAIINARPIVPVSNDPQNPEVLSPSTLLTYKIECDQQNVGDLDLRLLYKKQWQKVQHLADQFWHKWRHEYLQSLQARRKWKQDQDPLKPGDVVLMKSYDSVRNYWPLARILRIFPGDDGRVHKVEVSVFRENKIHTYIRPIVDLVLLVKSDE